MGQTVSHVGFIGLGNMGRGMAANLVRSGFRVSVWNRTMSRAADLVAAGATLAPSIADAARAGIVATMVADDKALEEIVWTNGLLDALPRGGIHLSHSTISIALADRLAAAHAERGSAFVSAPVFGRPEAAAAAKLFVVAAGAADALDRAQPLLDAVGQRTFRFGDRPSAANVVKLSGNFLIASMIESWAKRSRWCASRASIRSGPSSSSRTRCSTRRCTGRYGGIIADGALSAGRVPSAARAEGRDARPRRRARRPSSRCRSRAWCAIT